MGIHSGVSGYFNKWQEVRSGTNNTWIEYTIPAKSYNSITYNQASTADVYPGQQNAEIIRLDVNVSGGTGSLYLNSIQINANNTSNSDIASSGVKLYRTSTTTFSTANPMGTAQSLSSGVATFSSLNYDLPGGTTYIWAVYDLSSNAVLNNTVDMYIVTSAIDIGGVSHPASTQNPSGNRSIVFYEWDGSTSTDWNVGSNWSTNSVPSSTDHVVIPSSPSNQPHLYNGDAGECNNLIINSGASMTVDNTGEFDIYGDINNDGTFAVTNYDVWLYGANNIMGGSGVYATAEMRLIGSGKHYTLSHNINCALLRIDNGSTLDVGDYYLSCPTYFQEMQDPQ